MTWRAFRGGKDRDLDEELDAHVHLAIQDRLARGESPGDARRHAHLEFGNRLLVKEATRSVWTWTALEQLVNDMHLGCRILWRAPGLSATAAFLIALVIGGNTTVFSVVHGLLTKPAPGVTADRVVSLGWVHDRGDVHPGGSYPNYLDIAATTRTLSSTLAAQYERFILTIGDGSYAIQGGLVTRRYFETLAIPVSPGRAFSDQEASGAASGLVAVISQRLWREHFGESPTVVGQSTVLNGHPVTIVGVAPPRFQGFFLGEGSDVWVPIEAYARMSGAPIGLSD